jgi:hypothetical protein
MTMGSLQLHPNLARIAASYQDLVSIYATGRIDASVASVRARELIARDDLGVLWTINPKDGGWLRCVRDGSWVPDVPPTAGYATLTASHLSGGHNDDASLMFSNVGPATFRQTTVSAQARERRDSFSRPGWIYPLLVGATLVVGLFTMLARMDNGESVSYTTLPEAVSSSER